ncbi:MAG: ISKra4 family transposase, partial [Opitutae bacterium]|nr:ISKra4 family transposase [Opitutae bacterium]
GLDTQIHAVGDGAPWIAEQARVQFGAQGRYTLDLDHACDYLAAAAAAPDPARAKPFVEPLREALRRSEHPSVLAALRLREEPSDCPDEQAPVRAALRYLGHRTAQLDYAYALARELPVGSGLIESGHRHVLQARIKKAGAWWTEANAHALCQLRTLRANLQWDQYWDKN